MGQVSVPQLRKLVDAAHKKAEQSALLLETEKDNPSVRDCYYKALGELEVLEDLRAALHGRTFPLSRRA